MSATEQSHLATHDISCAQYQAARKHHWNSITDWMIHHKGLGRYYHRRLSSVYRLNIAPNMQVLEIGCSQGDLLSSVNPSFGVGIDISEKMIEQARSIHPDLHFYVMDALEIDLEATISFDYIILSDILNDLWDIQVVLERIHQYTNSHTRIILNTYSRLWEVPLAIAEKLGLAKPVLYQNWLTIDDIVNLLNLSGYEMVRSWQEILFPIEVPLLTSFCNRFLVKFLPFNLFALTNFIIARPKNASEPTEERPSVSIVIPARNEAGNIPCIFENLPRLRCKTEYVFVEGHSKDNTNQVIQEQIDRYPELQCYLYQQTGIGKGNAVREGFDHASGDILMILDADLTVPISTLARFYEAISSGRGDFINGVRLVYPVEKQSMKFLNFLGNKFFSLAFSWLLGQPIKDTLCGTKVLWKSDYERIVKNRAFFGDFDPFGDFDLLLGAAKLGLKILDLPIRYRERTYGTTNIQRWKHGWLLLKMTYFAARRLKFV
jgi:2-polyprenyl-3-methyl-5-hydroxy-6-metoxy-1,4-benzoquinol methylase